MRWLLTITLAVVLCGCSTSSASASQLSNEVKTKSVETRTEPKTISFLTMIQKRELTFLEKRVIYEKRLVQNREKLNKVVIRLIHRVGRTPYVFSGSSIYGWDCSGMVRWAYEQVGRELPHSATKQAYAGKRIKKQDLKVGDVVVFGYKGYKSFYHSAIYIGKGKVINANRGFGGTHIQPITDFQNSRIVYVRILETP